MAWQRDDDWDDDNSAEDDDADEPATVECPHCQREVYEDAERCPHCEHYLSAEDRPPRAKPWWILLGFAACAWAIYSWFRR